MKRLMAPLAAISLVVLAGAGAQRGGRRTTPRPASERDHVLHTLTATEPK